MGSRLLTATALFLSTSGCLVDRALYEERRAALAGAADADGDGFLASVDCDDGDDDVNPGAAEIYYNGVDEDCDTALTPDGDQDADGALLDDDCDDRDPRRSPAFDEAPYDGADNDCDGGTPDDDLDGDTFPLADDCDDGDPTVNPAALEVVYDGLDNDCQPGSRDDDLDGDGAALADDCDDADPTRTLIAAYHLDLDADGYGDPAVDSTGCAGDPIPEGALLDGADCDDLDAYVNPTTKWYEDADGDGYGAGPATVACGPGPGFALVASDCADGDATTFPGALDAACEDGISAPCTGVDTTCHSKIPFLANFGLDAPGGPSRIGFRTGGDGAAVVGDFDGNADGLPDVAVGDEQAGSLSFFDTTDLDDAPVQSGAWASVGSSPSPVLALARAGDVDGDGFDDLLVGAPLAPVNADPAAMTGLGHLYVVYGPSGSDYFGKTDLPVQITVPLNTDPGLGAAVGSAGDVDADGFDDVLVGAGNGVAWLVMGTPARLPSASIADVRELKLVDGPVPTVASALGHVDIDADGLDDVVVGLPLHGSPGGPAGAVAVYGGDVLDPLATGTIVDPGSTARLLLTGDFENELAGTSVAAGDVNLDGTDDLLVGAPGYGKTSEGRVFIFTGSGSVKTDEDFELADAYVKITGTPSGELGRALAVLEGTSAFDETEIAIGGLDFVSLLPVTFGAGTFTLESLELTRAVQTGIGSDLSAAGDMDRDGHGDLLIGRENTDLFVDAAAWLLFGTE